MLSVEHLRSIAVMKLVSESGGGLGVASELLIVCFDGVRRAGEVSPVFGRFALGDMTVNQTVCFAEHVQCVQSRRGESGTDFTAIYNRNRFTINT